jgi:predicted house-cleaning noncanonical NTP pyrophosphatase (MazG superfamily)|tara:strand:+ start:377 stop:850 length:474 start_codon:yes stop_codon:yes gene_type:complete
MIYSSFTEKTKTYLKSLRILKDYASFDVYFNTSWSIPKKYVEGIEVIKSDNSDRVNFNVFSFVVPNTPETVNNVEKSFDEIIKYNKDREEKERLFKEKIQELKRVFESKNVEELKGLHFEMNELTTSLSDLEEENLEKNGQGTGEHADVVQEREVEG